MNQTGPSAYRGYLIVRTIASGLSIQKDGFHIAFAATMTQAIDTIDMLLKS